MKVQDIFEASRSEFDWNQEAYAQSQQKPSENATNYGIFSLNGKVVRSGLTRKAALLLAQRPDLIKKFGKLVAKMI